MTQKHRLAYLIAYLINENPALTAEYRDSDISFSTFRALCNIREPKPISKEFLEIQDAYLQEEINNRGVFDSVLLIPVKKDSRIFLWQGDITTIKCDAIVNAANNKLLGCFHPNHACIDNFIQTYAGVQLRLACFDIMQKQGHLEETGVAKITPAFNLPCKYVIHTVGPIVHGKLIKQHEKLLASCYRSCLELADENKVGSIAFCCISTGVFGFPQQRAAEIAVETVQKYYDETDSRIKVVFNVFKDEDLEIYRRLVN